MIEAKNLSKTYEISRRTSLFKWDKKYIEAVKNISFQITKGEFVGLIGLNGAGKSSTTKMLTGILTPSSGNVWIDGIKNYEERHNLSKKIGVLFGHRNQLFWDLKVEKTFIFYKHLYDINDIDYSKRLAEIDDYLDIYPLFEKSARFLSLGQKMRANFALIFLHRPAYVFLDEPTIGLDIITKQKVREFLTFHNQKYKTTILLTSHDMDDIELLCNRIILLHKGLIRCDQDIHSFTELYSQKNEMIIECMNQDKINAMINTINLLDGIDHIKSKNSEIKFFYDCKKISYMDIIQTLMHTEDKNTINDIHHRKLSFEELIKDFYTKE